jgi:hypothetical protein
MTRVVSGGCCCGGIGYEYVGEVGAAGYCHCEDCRRISGSAFGVSVRVAAKNFRIVRGEPKGFTKPGESGRAATRYFCPHCGSPIYTAPALHPETVFIKAGSLDDPTLVKPDRQAWMRSRVAWATIAPGLTTYEKNRV